MKCSDVIAYVDKVCPSMYDADTKYNWLSECEGNIYSEVLCTHEDNPFPDGFDGYTPESADEKLVADYPYDDLYGWYVQAQIHLANQEYAKYNNAMAMYNSRYRAFADHYNRKHMSKQVMPTFKFSARKW